MSGLVKTWIAIISIWVLIAVVAKVYIKEKESGNSNNKSIEKYDAYILRKQKTMEDRNNYVLVYSTNTFSENNENFKTK